MIVLEAVCSSIDVPNQLLDTEAGSPADLVYPRLGWHRRDVIPNYGISPKDGRLIDEAFYYKDLKKYDTAA